MAATLLSWQMCVELDLAAGTVSTGHLWQCWPQFGDLGQMDFSKQLFLLAEAIKTQPGSGKPVPTCPCPSGAGSQSLFP